MDNSEVAAIAVSQPSPTLDLVGVAFGGEYGSSNGAGPTRDHCRPVSRITSGFSGREDLTCKQKKKRASPAPEQPMVIRRYWLRSERKLTAANGHSPRERKTTTERRQHPPRERKTTAERRHDDLREQKTTAGRRQPGLRPLG